MREKLKSINNIPFLLCLGMLLLNDFYLKTTYHNWLTGKLSDFSGLFVFVSFWSAFFPNKKRTIYFSTALLFVVWKSPYSQSCIDLFSYYLYPIYRVVDVTDLIALLILPVAYYYNSKGFFRLKSNPLPLAILAIFSFCATSMPVSIQKFEQPQYLLFKDGIKQFKNSENSSIYKIHKIDSFVIVNIEELIIDKRPAIDDSYHKTQVLTNIDLRFLRQINDTYQLQSKLADYKVLLDKLTVHGTTSIKLKLDSIRSDHLNFKKTRLNGTFKRFAYNKLLIDGKYKDGIEDSIWTFYNNQNEIIAKKYFEHGELIKNQLFENSKIKSEKIFNTRIKIIKYKYFHLAFISLLIIGLLVKLCINFKKTRQADKIKTSNFFKIAGSLIWPFVIFFIAKSLSSLIPNSHSPFFLEIFGEAILVYIVTVPLLLLIFYAIKLSTKFDLIYYILLFSLLIILIKELIFLASIMIS